MLSAVLSVLSGKTALVHQQRAAPVTRLSTILKDHLGSTDVIITGRWVATTFGEIRTERQSFDPWGERRDPATLALFRQSATDPFRTSSEDHDRGYTGHEQLDDSGLIHMNGRIYDPELGRMLSPDPFVQVPEYSQNFNRYSYVLNNPLNKTDPSGYSWLSEAFDKVGDWFSENWRTVVSIVVAVVITVASYGTLSAWGAGAYTAVAGTTAGASTAGAAFAGAAIGATTGAFNAAINGGDWSDIGRGALIGGIQGGITAGLLHGWEPAAGGFDFETARHVVGHGVVGGAANEAMGGKFSDGFLSAAASAAASNFGLLGDPNATGPGAVASRTIRAGIVGGTASALGGGKFANGAWTAAFQHLLNAEGGVKKVIHVFAYNGNDNGYGEERLANGKDFEASAKTLAQRTKNSALVNFDSYHSLKSQLEGLIKDHQIGSLYIMDHGDKNYQAIGDEKTGNYILPNSKGWSNIAKLVMRNGSIYLCGCKSGANDFNANMYSRYAPGRVIVLFRNEVTYPRGGAPPELIAASPVRKFTPLNNETIKQGF